MNISGFDAAPRSYAEGPGGGPLAKSPANRPAPHRASPREDAERRGANGRLLADAGEMAIRAYSSRAAACLPLSPPLSGERQGEGPGGVAATPMIRTLRRGAR